MSILMGSPQRPVLSVRVLAHQVFNVKRHLPAFIGRRLLEIGHPALLGSPYVAGLVIKE